MSDEIKYRLAQKEELPRVSDFRKTFFEYNSAVRSCESNYYEWKYFKNPIQDGRLWLAEDDNKIAAIKGVTPKKMKILSNIVNGGEMGDSFTQKNYQRRGIFTRISRVARESAFDDGVSFIYNTPNKDTSLPGYLKKLNHAPIPIKLHNLIMPINIKNLLIKNLPIHSLSYVLSPIFETISKFMFTINMYGIKKNNIIISQLTGPFVDEVDTFYEKASVNYDIILVRNKDYLNWRYLMNPDNYSILIARDENNLLLGYMVTKVGYFRDNKVSIGFIVDYLILNSNLNIFKKLLYASIKEFYLKKVGYISVWSIKGTFYYKGLVKAGFFPYKRVPFLCYQNDIGNLIINNNYKWHFTMGDTDNI